MNARIRDALGALLVVVLSAGLGACGPQSNGDADAGSPDRYTCTRDPVALDRGGSCQWDDACPCGAHCELGACTSDCRSDGDCGAGQLCDAFGRCIAQDAPTVIARPVSGVPRGTLAVSGATIDLDPQHTTGTFVLDARGGDTGPLRAETRGPVQLQCEPGGEFKTACSWDNLTAAQGAQRLKARISDPGFEGVAEVRLFSSGRLDSIHVRSTPRPAPTQKPLEGVYKGYARPVGLGNIARTTPFVPPNQVTEFRVEVEATVYPESGNRRVVEISDALDTVFPARKTVAEILRASTGELQFRQTRRAYLGKGIGGAADVDVAVATESVAFTRGLSGFGMTLKSRFSGILDGANDPYAKWEVALTRVGDLPAGASAPTPPSPYVEGDVAVRASAGFPAEAKVEAQLQTALNAVSNPTNEQLAEALICSSYGAAAPSYLEDQVRTPWSGDLGCKQGADAPTQQLVFGVLKESTWHISTLLSRCMADLQQTQDVNAGTATPSAGQGCVDGARLLATLKYAQDTDRRRALGQVVPTDPQASALEHRLLQLWLQANMFVARQATQVDVLNDVLANESQITRGFKQSDMLALTARGFDLLLHPRVALPMSRIPASVLQAPDYRLIVKPSGTYVANPRHDQGVGLPVVVMTSLKQSLDVYAALYERARYIPAEAPALEASAREFVRKGWVLYALASTLYETTRANNVTVPAWDGEWKRQTQLFGVGIAGLQRSIENLRTGGNPLDIDDKLDLPLYRIGDQTGSISRFSALTDYLLGTGTTSSTAIVPSRVAAAENALGLARDAWSQNLTRDFTTEQDAAAQQRREEAIRVRYGEIVTSLCGDPDISSNQILSIAGTLSPDTCFIRADCRRPPEAQLASLRPGDVAFTLCAVSGIREKLGDAASGPVIASGFQPALVAPIVDGAVTVQGHSVNGATLDVRLSDGSTLAVSTALFELADRDATPELPPEELSDLLARCRAVSAASEAVRPGTAPQACAFHGDCPVGMLCQSGACAADVGTQDETACYYGALGELAADIRTTATDIDIARSQLDDLTAAYDIQMRKCMEASLGAQQKIDAIEAHNRTMTTLGAVKLAADVAANAAASVKDCASAVGADNKFGTAGTVACGAAIAEGTARSVSDGMQFAMDQAEQDHALNLEKIDAATDQRTCFTEAELSLVGTHTAVLQVTRASQELARQLVEFRNRKIDMGAALDEGAAALALEQSLAVSPINFEFWLDERVEQYDAAFRSARRALYLAVLAVEYEYQISSAERANVLAATRVSQLKDVLLRLQSFSATGSIKGRLPTDLHAVVSLRQNLLQLSDQSALPPGWHQLNDTQRLQAMLTSPVFARYGPDGSYLGQEVPFRLAPLSSLQLGEARGVPIVAGADCAERVWSVNAALVGKDLLEGTDSTRSRVTLKKRNTFFSQWCGAPPSGAEAFQVAATRPSRNLFLDPFRDYQAGGAGSVPTAEPTFEAAAEANAFSSARLQPYTNITRETFDSDAYAEGASRELAGRGVYGDYTLFFPAESLGLSGSPGLHLERLEDVLLRFDYVSVAQN